MDFTFQSKHSLRQVPTVDATRRQMFRTHRHGHHLTPFVMLLVGPLAVVAVLSGSRTLLNASTIEIDAHTDRIALTTACMNHMQTFNSMP